MRPKPKKKKRVVRKKKTTVVVGNLPPVCDVDDLRELFSHYGEVTDIDITKYGIVSMKTPEQAQEAAKKLNNSCFQGYCISAEIAKSKRIIGIKPTTKASFSIFNSTLQRFAFHKLVMNLISRPDIATCLSVIPGYDDYETEFEIFLDLIESLEGIPKLQLAAAIFPLFVHFYFNMIDETQNADTFYCKFVHIFESSKDYKDVLKELYEIKSRTNIEEHPYFKNFRIKKSILRLSPDVLERFQSFLKDIESKALLQTLSLYFYYEESDVELVSTRISKKKSKRFKMPIRRRRLKRETNDSIHVKKHTTVKKKPTAKDQNLKKKKESECLTSNDLIDVAEFESPILRTAVDWFKSDIYAMDFNEDSTELCISFGGPFLFISSFDYRHRSKNITDKFKEDPVLKKYFPDDDEDDDDDDSDEEDEISGKRIPFRDPVRAVKYFPNQPYLLLAASGTEITKVNTADGTITSFGSGHIGEIWDIDINSTGSLFCTGSTDMSCRLWSMNNSSVVRIYSGHTNTVTTVKFHPNGMYLLSGSRDYDIRVWSIENGLCLRSLVDHKSPVTSLACSPDKKTIASADTDGIVRLWDIEDNIVLCVIHCFKENKYDGSKINSMCFTDENFLGLCNSRGIIRIWDVRPPEVVLTKYYLEHIPVFLKANHFRTWSTILRKRNDDMVYYNNKE